VFNCQHSFFFVVTQAVASCCRSFNNNLTQFIILSELERPEPMLGSQVE
jgi:hypothetical protein